MKKKSKIKSFQGIKIGKNYISNEHHIYKLIISDYNNKTERMYLKLIMSYRGDWIIQGFYNSSLPIDILYLHNLFKRRGLELLSDRKRS